MVETDTVLSTASSEPGCTVALAEPIISMAVSICTGAKLANIFSTEFIVETADSKEGKKYKQACVAARWEDAARAYAHAEARTP